MCFAFSLRRRHSYGSSFFPSSPSPCTEELAIEECALDWPPLPFLTFLSLSLYLPTWAKSQRWICHVTSNVLSHMEWEETKCEAKGNNWFGSTRDIQAPLIKSLVGFNMRSAFCSKMLMRFMCVSGLRCDNRIATRGQWQHGILSVQNWNLDLCTGENKVLYYGYFGHYLPTAADKNKAKILCWASALNIEENIGHGKREWELNDEL